MRSLHGVTTSQNEGFAQPEDQTGDVPTEIEGVVDEMLTALRDRVCRLLSFSRVVLIGEVTGYYNPMVGSKIHGTDCIQGSR